MTRIITVSSGKGGVGKTHISTNLSLLLVQMGYRTCLLDADLGLANVNILLRIYPERTLKDVIFEGVPLRDILIRTPEGLDILPGSSGIEAMAGLQVHQIGALVREFATLDPYDCLIIDTAAGISKDVLAFCLAASELLLVLTPDPASLTDAYALLKVLHLNGMQGPVRVLVNQATSAEKARTVLLKLIAAARSHLGMELHPIGVLPKDACVPNALAEQEAFLLRSPQSPVSKSLRSAAQNLIHKKNEGLSDLYPQAFLEKFLFFFTGPLRKRPKDPTGPSLPPPETPPAKPPESQPPAGPPDPVQKIQASPLPAPPEDPETRALLHELRDTIATMATELRELRELFLRTHEQTPAAVPPGPALPAPPPRKTHPLTALLSQFPVFQTLNPEELQEVLGRLKFKGFSGDVTLMKKGERGKNLFILVSGKVSVLDAGGGLLDTMKAGDVFGEMSLISGEPVNATIRTAGETRVLYLEGREFMRLLRTYPEMQMYFARLLSQRMTKRLQKMDLARIRTATAELAGSLEMTQLPELLQMLRMGQKTGLLTLFIEGGPASVSLLEGEMISAIYGKNREKEAFYQILKLKKGRFHFTPELPPDDLAKKPMGHFMKLLMDGVSMMDEDNHHP